MSNYARRQRQPRREGQAVLDLAVLVSRVWGCSCDPDLKRRHDRGVTNVTVCHDEWCSMADHTSQVVIRRRGE
jgi:hypothetical protein